MLKIMVCVLFCILIGGVVGYEWHSCPKYEECEGGTCPTYNMVCIEWAPNITQINTVKWCTGYCGAVCDTREESCTYDCQKACFNRAYMRAEGVHTTQTKYVCVAKALGVRGLIQPRTTNTIGFTFDPGGYKGPIKLAFCESVWREDDDSFALSCYVS